MPSGQLNELDSHLGVEVAEYNPRARLQLPAVTRTRPAAPSPGKAELGWPNFTM